MLDLTSAPRRAALAQRRRLERSKDSLHRVACEPLTLQLSAIGAADGTVRFAAIAPGSGSLAS
jgi:hypothetical protein